MVARAHKHQMFFINHELASKQYAFAVAIAIVIALTIAIVWVRMFWSLIHLSAQISSLSLAQYLSTTITLSHTYTLRILTVHRPLASLLLCCYCIWVLFIYVWLGFLSGRILSAVSASAHTHTNATVWTSTTNIAYNDQTQVCSKNKTKKKKIGFGTKAAAAVVI